MKQATMIEQLPSKMRQDLSKGERSPNQNYNETNSARGSDNETSTGGGGSAMALVKKNVKNVAQRTTKAMK